MVDRRIASLEDASNVAPFERGQFWILLAEARKDVMLHVHRMFDDFDAVLRAEQCKAAGFVEWLRLGVQAQAIGRRLQRIVATWPPLSPDVSPTPRKLNDNEHRLLTERRLYAGFAIGLLCRSGMAFLARWLFDTWSMSDPRRVAHSFRKERYDGH